MDATKFDRPNKPETEAHTPNYIMDQLERASKVLNNTESSAAQLEEAMRETNPYRLRTNHFLEWCNIRGIEPQTLQAVRDHIESSLTRLGVQYEPEFSPLNFIPPSDRKRYSVQYFLPHDADGVYRADIDDIAVKASVVGRAERAFPLLDFRYPSVAKHEEIHRLHWTRHAKFLNLEPENAAKSSASQSPDSNGAPTKLGDNTQDTLDALQAPVTARVPLAFSWLDEAWAYSHDTKVDGAMTLEWQITHMLKPETYSTYIPPTQEYAETMIILVAAAIEIGITDEEFFDYLIEIAYNGTNSAANPQKVGLRNIRGFEEQAVLKCQNFVLNRFRDKGLLAQNSIDPLAQLNEYAKRHFIRAALKRSVADLVEQEALTEVLTRATLPTGIIVHEYETDHIPDRIFLPLGPEVQGVQVKNKLYLLLRPSVDFIERTPELRSRIPFVLQIVDYDVATGDARNVSYFLPEGNPALVNSQRIAKMLLDAINASDLNKILSHVLSHDTLFEPELSQILHGIGDSIITELAQRQFLSQKEAELIKAIRELRRTAMQYSHYVKVQREVMLTDAEEASLLPDKSERAALMSAEQHPLVHIYGFDVGPLLTSHSDQQSTVFTFTIPTSAASRLAAENRELIGIGNITFMATARDEGGRVIQIPDGIIYEQPGELVKLVANSIKLDECQRMLEALREKRFEEDPLPGYDEVTGKQSFIEFLQMQLAFRIENKRE